VKLASGMESTGATGRIHVSQETFELQDHLVSFRTTNHRCQPPPIVDPVRQGTTAQASTSATASRFMCTGGGCGWAGSAQRSPSSSRTFEDNGW
jgi:hypothetical protein